MGQRQHLPWKIQEGPMQSIRATLLICALAMIARPVSGQPTTTIIDCKAGQSLAAAVATAAPGTTIAFSGVCSGPINWNTSNLTLDCGGAGVINGGSSTN